MKTLFVYIVASISRTIYVGVTNNLERRIDEHKRELIKGFTKRYKITKLVYYESYDSPIDAIAREKQIKGWRRAKKAALVESTNPGWMDLSLEWTAKKGTSSG